MLSILELPSVRRQAVPIDIRTYHWMASQGLIAERTELLRGVIVEKMSKSPLHSAVARMLLEICQAAVDANHFVTKEDPLTLADSEPEPDIAIISGNIHDFRDSHPTSAVLVIEVAVSSVELDREKAFLYAEANIPEYWLVLPESRTLEIFSEPASGAYQRHQSLNAGEVATSASMPNLQVQLDQLFG
jgi:Uma2 family endonuclease